MSVLQRLLADKRGTMVVETALVAPVLILMAIGGFQVSDLVARQHNLESAAAMAEQIALAAKPDSQTKINTMKSVISASTGVPAAHIQTSFIYRCGTTTATQNNNNCGTDPAWTFVQIVLIDTYVPAWTHLGIGSNVALRVSRTVQIS